MNKLRFKDGKRDLRGFKAFLESEHLPRGFISRYIGNHLHMLFGICGKYHEKYDAILSFLQSGTVVASQQQLQTILQVSRTSVNCMSLVCLANSSPGPG